MIRNGNSCVTRLKHRIATESICPLLGTSQPCVLNPRLRRMNVPFLFLVSLGMLSLAFAAHAGGVVRAEIEPGVSAVFRGGRDLFLECRPPRGEASQTFFDKYLANPNEWRIYKDRIAVAIHFDRLRPEVRRRVLLTVFDRDYVDESGWWHTAVFSEKEGHESLWNLCEWLTGRGANYRAVMADKRNGLKENTLPQGSRVLIPNDLLIEAMKEPSPKPEPERSAEQPAGPPVEEAPVDLDAAARGLTYGSDAEGPYAMYRVKQGESLYTAVVVRFTDISGNQSILDACELIRKRSGVKDVRGMKPGQKIVIPMDMLSDRFRPKESEQRKEYEETISEAKRLRKEQVRTRDLDGVAVVIDPGHGGRDHGCANEKLGLYEDELNYDIACRVKKILEAQTRAKVYITLQDRSQKYAPSDKSRFTHDRDEELLTTPRYQNDDAKISANLRWYLANAIYHRELEAGTDPRKVVFTSFHTDALYDGRLRGSMIYIPGAKYRRESEEPDNVMYAQFKEARDHRSSTSSEAERRRDEALSRNFAEDIMTALGKKRIRRHLEGAWIRSQIRQEWGRVYVPAVLRNTLIPTKTLIETANMTNEPDCKRLADPKWRQDFAQAYVDALKMHFGST